MVRERWDPYNLDVIAMSTGVTDITFDHLRAACVRSGDGDPLLK